MKFKCKVWWIKRYKNSMMKWLKNKWLGYFRFDIYSGILGFLVLNILYFYFIFGCFIYKLKVSWYYIFFFLYWIEVWGGF